MKKNKIEAIGIEFPGSVVEAVWEKGSFIPFEDRDVYRVDILGNRIKRSEYGKHTEYGWQIDHIIPQSKGGPDDIINLQPLQWQANNKKSNIGPYLPPGKPVPKSVDFRI